VASASPSWETIISILPVEEDVYRVAVAPVVEHEVGPVVAVNIADADALVGFEEKAREFEKRRRHCPAAASCRKGPAAREG
jgi:hypothetical protein